MAPYGSNTVTVRRQCLNSSQGTFEFNDTGGLTERTVFPQCARCLFPHVHGGRYREGVHPKGKTSYPTVALNKKVTRLKLNSELAFRAIAARCILCRTHHFACPSVPHHACLYTGTQASYSPAVPASRSNTALLHSLASMQ